MYLWCCLFLVTFSGLTDARERFKPHFPQSGPWQEPTTGRIWPQPALAEYEGNRTVIVDREKFQFKLNDAAASCKILTDSLPRFKARMFPGSQRKGKSVEQLQEQQAPEVSLNSVNIILNGICEVWPHLAMNESYELLVSGRPHAANFISSSSVWGLLRGMESLSQLVVMDEDENGALAYSLHPTYVLDSPRFPHRGFLVDTARHFQAKSAIMDMLDLMEINKMNVFHWHMTDDESFPFVSSVFPQLSEKGAYDPKTHVYRPEDVEEIVEAARVRGIRVIPEFDTPGHTRSWGEGMPELLTKCYDINGTPTSILGPMDPTKEDVYRALTKLYQEIATVFPDEYVHIGGDEVSNNCWKSDPSIRKILEEAGGRDFRKLQSYFVSRVQQIAKAMSKKSIVWQEVFDNGDPLYSDSIVQVWKAWGTGWRNTLRDVTDAKKMAILSAPWYLDHVHSGSDWLRLYNEDPMDFQPSNNATAKQLVLGGEACLWAEYVNSVNLVQRAWPRASAVAERLWSPMEVKNEDDAARRLEEHQCRMLSRGYSVQPQVGAGFCHVVWQRK